MILSMIWWMVSSLAVAQTATPSTPILDPLGIAGAWTVTDKGVYSTCGDELEISSYSWLVSARAGGRYDVVVTGKTAFPAPTGGVDTSGTTLRLVAYNGDDSGSFWDLRLASGQMIGRRFVVHTETIDGSLRVCLFERTIVAARSGGTDSVPF